MYLSFYIEIHPNAFATELIKMIVAKIGHKYRIITLKIFFLRNALSPCITSSSMLFVPTTFDTSRQVAIAAIGIITEFVRKSKKSRNCIPISFTQDNGPYPIQDKVPANQNNCLPASPVKLILKGRHCTLCQCNRACDRCK